MPGIVVFRRRWSVGSDDLVVPGGFLFLIHLVWVIVLGILLGLLEWDRSIQCVLLLWEYILGYLVIFVSSMAIEFSMCLLATRGSILDTTARAPMQYLLYVRLFLLIVEAAWLSAGVTWLARFYQTCPVEQAKDIMLGLVISNWCVLLSILVTVWCVYDAAGRSWVKMKKYQRSMREAESRSGRLHYKRSGSRNRNWRQRKVIRAYQDSWDNRCRILFCCIGKSDRNRNSFADIARLLSDFFRDLDVVPSDVVAGLVLLRKFQKIEREMIVKQRKNDTYEFLSGVPVTPRTKFLSLTEDGDLGHFQAAIHYMHFALAAYGWPLFLFDHSTGLCQLCTELRCCCFPCARNTDEAIIVEDNCCQCNYAALRRMVEVGEIEVVYATFHVDVGETPFFVALDYTRRKVVVSIRGTLSMKDVMTDLNAEGEVLPLTPPRDDWLGHKGMVQAAEYIRKKLNEEAIISKALERDQSRGTHEFGLTLVGHSLGAGTAAILAVLLRQEYPDLICFAYAPPGGLLSMPAQEYTQEFITSVVVGKDVVPRIGLRQMESLRADIVNAIKRSVDPKWKTITCSVMCCGCGAVPTSAANLEAGGCISEYQRDKDLARSETSVPPDSNVAFTLHKWLYPPGRIIHVVRHHPSKSEPKHDSRWRQLLRKREPVYQALWAGPCDFDEVLISPVMIQDHMPDSMFKALNKVSEHREVSAELSAMTAAAAATATVTTSAGPTAILDAGALRTAAAEVEARVHRTRAPPPNGRPDTSKDDITEKIKVKEKRNALRSGYDKVVTILGPAKPQRVVSGRVSSASEHRQQGSAVSLSAEAVGPEEERAPLVSSSPLALPRGSTLVPAQPRGRSSFRPPLHSSPASEGGARRGLGRGRLCLETSFASLQSPLTDNYPHIGRELSVDSRGLPWEYVSIASEILASPARPAAELIKASNRATDWSSLGRLAPLATPETMSEASSSNPPSPLMPGACHNRPMTMMRRTPKIAGNLSTAADDLRNNLHFALLAAKSYYPREEAAATRSGCPSSASGDGGCGGGSSSNNSAPNSEASYGSGAGHQGPPPPVPRRRDSVFMSREHQICMAACCRDELSENSSPLTSHSSRLSPRVELDFPKHQDGNTNGPGLDPDEAKAPRTVAVDAKNQDGGGGGGASSDVLLGVRSSPECKGLMAPVSHIGAEWRRAKRHLDLPIGDAALPLLRGLAPAPHPGQQHLGSSPFFGATKRKKYVYPITLVGRGESSV